MTTDRCGVPCWHRHSAGQPTAPCQNKRLPGKETCWVHDPDRSRLRDDRERERSRRLYDFENAARHLDQRVKAMVRVVRREFQRDLLLVPPEVIGDWEAVEITLKAIAVARRAALDAGVPAKDLQRTTWETVLND